MRDFLNGKKMKVELECFPCFFRQAVISLKQCGADEIVGKKVMKAVLEEVADADVDKSPAHATSHMHRRIRNILGCDPFEEVKRRYNRIALEQYPDLKRTVTQSPDPLRTASRLAIAGNVIDFGIFTSVDLEGTVKRALEEPLNVDHYEAFKKEVEGVSRVLYLLDNAGEVVFDRMLIEELLSMGREVTAVVKGGPVINDCTMEDAREAGIAEICEVIDNGSDAVGTILDTASLEFRKRFIENRALVVSKGQGNFETLLNEKRNIFFLFQSKCPVVSRVLGLPEGSMLLAKGGY